MLLTLTALVVLILITFWLYRSAPAWTWVWAFLTLVAIGLLAVFDPLNPLTIPLLAGWALVGVAANAGVRRRWFTAPLLRRFRTVLPRLSETEQQALEAGTIGWDAELFSGRPAWERLLETPPAQLAADEQAFLDGPVEALCRMVDDWQVTHHDHDLSAEAWSFIRSRGFFGMIIPKGYGGLGFSHAAHSAVVMKIATRSVTAAVTVMVPNSLGPGKLLLRYGTDEQRDYYLPRLARGEEIPCFALTSPKAGSDAGAIPDTGVVCRGMWQGREVLGLRLNWDKRYITLGPVATLIGLAFRCLDPDRLLGGSVDRGITVALVPRDTPGIEIGSRHIPMDIPFMNGPNRGRDVFLPLTQVIGGKAGIGQGWRMLVESLSEGRGISLPALSTGAVKSAARFTGAYARVRRQFNLPIGRLEGVEEALARIAGRGYQMEAARLLTLAALEQGERPAVASAIVKYHLTEKYRQVINDAMDIEGGRGICLGPRNLLGRAYQAIPVAITVEGANILTRSMIIFGQGAIRCHPWVLKEFRAVHHPDSEQGLREFDRALLGHVGFLLGNVGRSLVLGLSRGRFARAPASRARRYYQTLTWMSTALALAADAAMMTLGGALKRHERLSARMGDVFSELYLSSAVLKRFHDDGEPPEDYPLVRWALQDSLYRMQESLRSLYRNLPSRPLAALLRVLCFPTGMVFSAPADRADHEAAGVLLAPSQARDRLTRGLFVPPDPKAPARLLETAFQQAAALESLERRLAALRREHGLQARARLPLAQEAFERGLIPESDWQALNAHEALVDELVQVDDFPAFSSGTGQAAVHRRVHQSRGAEPESRLSAIRTTSGEGR
ncbi:Butyryl-CoA dehydrogenase [Thioalkalivibrio nitratireducens DSM 14787]|uniref:Acyl-coenzyme A dehydrogenase n=1 Tax=Thioalkalivibrio nitratireducens (strain DSM 14787 / UNIQEM 213 / ALEN2) TaxID=1255043 RepID=L0DUL8_THIND|nr:acyl-CoA dehydrogenase [Thioalkalivibrio nitratireducens]AGA32718.1 Butyryl-CoA dehydrogenase [Thioalkalivibrio nitratireducens DSM 14787]